MIYPFYLLLTFSFLLNDHLSVIFIGTACEHQKPDLDDNIHCMAVQFLNAYINITDVTHKFDIISFMISVFRHLPLQMCRFVT